MKKIRFFSILMIFCLCLSALAPAASALDAPAVDAQALVLVDMNTGEILLEKNMHEQRSPASLTKIMTGLLAVEAVERGEASLDDVVTAQPDCQTGLDSDSSNASIVTGEQMSLRDYLCCALVSSANEACNVIGSYLDGSIEAFVEHMNRRAEELGCANTHFSDPNGLANDNHYSSAYDLYLITREALRHPDFAAISATAEYTVPATNANEERHLVSSNALLTERGFYGPGYLYEGAGGVKTGFTRQAGYCLVSTAERGGIRLLAVVLGCNGPNLQEGAALGNFVSTRTLYDWVFTNFAYQQVVSAADPVEKVTIERATGDGTAILRAQSDVTLLLPNDVDPGSRELSVSLYEERLVAPVSAGTPLGQAVITVGGRNYGPIPLVTNTDIGLAKGQFLRQQLQAVLQKGWVKTVIVILLLFLALYIALVARYRRLRRKHLKERRAAEKRRQAARAQREAEQARARQEQSFMTVDPVERGPAEELDLSRFFDEFKKDEDNR